MEKEYHDYKIGDESPSKTGKITMVFKKTPSYFIYEIENSGEISISSKGPTQEIGEPIRSLASEIGFLLQSKKQKRKHIRQIAIAYGEALSGRSEQALEFLEKFKTNVVKQKLIRSKLSYLLSCLIFVLANIIIAIFLNTVFFSIIDGKIINLFTIATFGSIGGFLSISLRINSLELDIYESHIIQIWTGLTRIFIAMASSLILYVIIKANFALGFIDNLNSDYALYTFSCVAGFSEYFVPNILSKLENKKK